MTVASFAKIGPRAFWRQGFPSTVRFWRRVSGMCVIPVVSQ